MNLGLWLASYQKIISSPSLNPKTHNGNLHNYQILAQNKSFLHLDF
jgi:hypothetical protein